LLAMLATRVRFLLGSPVTEFFLCCFTGHGVFQKTCPAAGHVATAFVFVLILSPKKASEKLKGFGLFGSLKFNLLVKTGTIFLLWMPVG